MTPWNEQITANGGWFPSYDPRPKHFWEGCQWLGGRRRRLPPLLTALCGAHVWM